MDKRTHRKGTRLCAPRKDLKEDSWTYGDWRQYVYFQGDVAYCVRPSALNFLLFGFPWFGRVWVVLVSGPMHRQPGGSFWRDL